MSVQMRLQAAQEPAEAVSLRVLWFALRAPGGDPPAAPGIAYDTPRVQSTPTLHEPRLGACAVSPAQRVDARLDRVSVPAARRTLAWVRSQAVCPTVSLVGRALASEAERTTWARSPEAARVGPERVGRVLLAAALAGWEAAGA